MAHIFYKLQSTAKKSDIDKIIDFLDREHMFNVFLINNLMNWDKLRDNLEVSVLSSEKTEIEAVILKYLRNINVYSRTSEYLDLVASHLRNYALNNCKISGKDELLRELSEEFPFDPVYETIKHYAVCYGIERSNNDDESSYESEFAPEDDALEILDFLKSISEFADSRTSREQLAKDVSTGNRKVAIVRDPYSREILSTASYVAETDKSAMIIAVATKEGNKYRGKGLATLCLNELLNDLKEKKKTACIYYDNPAAGRIYQKLGFKEIGKWRILGY